jgi:hypothetical protein
MEEAMMEFGYRMTQKHPLSSWSSFSFHSNQLVGPHWQWCTSSDGQQSSQPLRRHQKQFMVQSQDAAKLAPSNNTINIIGGRLQLSYDKLPYKFVRTITCYAPNNFLQLPFIGQRRLKRRVRSYDYQTSKTRATLHSSQTVRTKNNMSSVHVIFRLLQSRRFTFNNQWELNQWLPAIQAIQLGPSMGFTHRYPDNKKSLK